MRINKKYTTEELNSLETWRGLLSVLVFIAHLFQVFFYPIIGADTAATLLFGNIANVSVVCFFVLSGMLISYSGLNLTTDNQFNWRKYLINRFSRIYPSFIFVLVICYLLVLIFPYLNEAKYVIVKLDTDKYIVRKKFFASINDIMMALQMRDSNILKINGPLWSLIIEWWLYFYGMFLMLFIFYKSKRNLFSIVFLLLAIFPLIYNYDFWGVASIYYALIWTLGFIYTYYLGENGEAAINWMLLIVVVALLVIVYMFGVDAINIIKSNPYQFGVLQLFFAVLFLKVMFKVKANKILNWFGGFSYTLYIIHFPVVLFIFSLTRRYVNNDPLLVAVEMFLSFLFVVFISYLISNFTEKKSVYRNFLYRLNDKYFTNNK